MTVPAEAPLDCPLCPRLVAYRRDNDAAHPDWFNAPVPSFGDANARLLIVGLAPGVQGANRTGRPFTGDYAGDLLYSTLCRFGFSRGTFRARPDDGVELIGAALTNAVRCVPPQNKPVGAEISTCRRFLGATVARYPNLRAIVTLGTVAHQSTVRALGLRVADFPFAHGARRDAGGIALFSSYHCSRYNTNTGVLTEAMFTDVFAAVRDFIGPAARDAPKDGQAGARR